MSLQAWGPKGHAIVVKLVLANLSPDQRARVITLLGTSDPYRIGNWADSIAHEQPATRPYHFVNIPASAATYEPTARYARTCVVTAILHCDSVLRDPKASSEDRRTALLFYLHLVADLYQPFHCYDNGDFGGNDVPVIFDGDTTSLHKLWDSDIINATNSRALAATSHLFYPPIQGLPRALSDIASRQHLLAVRMALPPGARILPKYQQHALRVIRACLKGAAATILAYWPLQ